MGLIFKRLNLDATTKERWGPPVDQRVMQRMQLNFRIPSHSLVRVSVTASGSRGNASASHKQWFPVNIQEETHSLSSDSGNMHRQRRDSPSAQSCKTRPSDLRRTQENDNSSDSCRRHPGRSAVVGCLCLPKTYDQHTLYTSARSSNASSMSSSPHQHHFPLLRYPIPRVTRAHKPVALDSIMQPVRHTDLARSHWLTVWNSPSAWKRRGCRRR